MKPMHPLMRLRKIAQECEQMIRDVESWNTNRTDADPLDCEPERIMLAAARRAQSVWARDKDEFEKIVNGMSAYGESLLKEQGEQA